MHSTEQDQCFLLYQRSYYQLFCNTGSSFPPRIIQTVDGEEFAHLDKENCKDLFANIDFEYAVAGKISKQGHLIERSITLRESLPIFLYLGKHASLKTDKVIRALFAFLEDLGAKRYNTKLTPYNLLYIEHSDKIAYIDLDCALPKGAIQSPLYRAPELLGKLNSVPAIQSDMYSVGMILYEHFLGSHPLAGLSNKKTRREQIVRQFKPLHKIQEGFPHALSLIIKKLLSKQPNHRYKTCYGLAKDIEDFFNGTLKDTEHFVPGTFDFAPDSMLTVPQSYITDKYKQLDHLLFETEERNHKIIFISGSQINASDLLTRNYLSLHSKSNVLIASAHIKENAKYLPFYTAALVFKEIASWLIHSKLYKDDRFLAFSQETDSIIIETLIHICPELAILTSEKFKPIDQPISDTNILYTAVKHLFRFLGTITKPLIICLNNTEYIDKDSTKLFFEILSTAEIPHLAFIFQSFGSTKQPKLFRNRNAKFTAIELRQMENKYIADMLNEFTNHKLDNIDGLVSVLQDKCLGKYELMRQFVYEMQLNGSLDFDRRTGMWHWNKEQLQSIESPLTLEEICLRKQKFMSQTSVELLKQAALIGNVFNLYLLSQLSGMSKEQLFIKLDDARKLNLIFELTQYSNFRTPENSIFFKFASDRAYRIFLKQGKHSYRTLQTKAFSQTVGYLIKKGNNKLLFEDFFASIQNFAPLVDTDTKAAIIQVMIEKIKDYIFLGKLNKADKLLELCFDLLPEHAWLDKYYLTKKLYYTAIVLSHNTNTFEQTDSLYKEATDHLSTPEDHIAFNFVYIDSRIKRNEKNNAIDILHKCAQLIDPELLQEKKSFQSIQNKFFGVMFRNRVLNNELKLCKEAKPRIQEKHETLSQINILAHKLDKQLYYNSLAQIIQSVFNHGMQSEFALPLLIYAKRLLDVRRHISFALKLASFIDENISEKYKHSDQCKLYYYTNIHPFSERIQSSKQKIKSAIDQKVSLGDLTTAYDLSFDYIFRSLVEGEKLQNLLNETKKIWRIKRKYSKQQLDFDLLTVFYERIKALYDHQRISDVTRNTEKFERQAKLSFWNNLTLLIYFYNTDHFDKALICAGNAQLGASAIENNLPLIMLEFYYCLSLAEDFPNMSNYRKLEALRYISMRHKELKKLTRHSKENFMHMALLLKGTLYRLSKRPARAIPTIKKAAYISEMHGNINIQAMCYKILAQVALDQDKKNEREKYLVKAYNYYKKWGANTIAERIKLDNFEVFEEMNLRIFNVI